MAPQGAESDKLPEVVLELKLNKTSAACSPWDEPRVKPISPGLVSDEHSLFGQHRTGFEQEAAERRVLVRNLRRSRGTLQVQTPDDDVQDGRYGRQLHAVEHGGQLGAERLHVASRQAGHGGCTV